MTDLCRDFGFAPGCLFLRSHGVLVAADLHIGMEEDLRSQGLHFPLREEETLLARFGEALDTFHPRMIVLNGDIIHSFATVPRRVKTRIQRILAFLSGRAEVILLAGSHDRLLPFVLGTPVQQSVDIGKWRILHGNQDCAGDCPRILGHEHPVLELDMAREPCFLFGEGAWDSHDLLILPAFNPLCQGVVVNTLRRGDLLAPCLCGIDPADLQPVVACAGEVFFFPALGSIRVSAPRFR